MTQEERRLYLIRYLLNEQKRLPREKIPDNKKDQENLLRALMNVRMPEPISEEFLKIQDDYLQEEIKKEEL